MSILARLAAKATADPDAWALAISTAPVTTTDTAAPWPTDSPPVQTTAFAGGASGSIHFGTGNQERSTLLIWGAAGAALLAVVLLMRR